MHELLEFINEEGEKILAKYSPQDLELVTCSFCGAVMRRYLLGRHVEEHEVKEAGEELKLPKTFLKWLMACRTLRILKRVSLKLLRDIGVRFWNYLRGSG